LNNLRVGNEAPHVYETKGKFQCARRKLGWDGNHPPDEQTELLELKISFAKLGLEHAPGRKIGLAFDVTDANGKAEQKAYFWSVRAKIASPRSWRIGAVE
jgi:hypothetical protein